MKFICQDCSNDSILETTEDAVESLTEAGLLWECSACSIHHPIDDTTMSTIVSLLKRDTPMGCVHCMELFSNMEALQMHECPSEDWWLSLDVGDL